MNMYKTPKFLTETLEYKEAERKNYIIEIIKYTDIAWENEMITDKAHNKIMNICAKRTLLEIQERKKRSRPGITKIDFLIRC